ncbi:MAG: hypothetical protein F7C82_05810 [Desulfurococcales archaeon]|nr:hypothetical protein [Desulfurococcales archaeon]
MNSIDVSLEVGSIHVYLDKGEKYVELDAKVIVGVKNGKIVDLEILLGREEVKKLSEILSQGGEATGECSH